MVEFALVAPAFFFAVLAVIDVSIALFAVNGMGDGVADAARRGAIAEQGVEVDENLLAEIEDRSESLVGVEVERIVVYRSEALGALPTEACQSGAGDASCVVYSAGALTDGPEPCEKTSSWCSVNRQPDDLLGVWVRSRYQPITGIAPLAFEWNDVAVTIIEPEVVR